MILSVSLKVFLRLLGTGTPASFLDIDYRAKEVRYELADLCAKCSRVTPRVMATTSTNPTKCIVSMSRHSRR